MRTGIGYDVHKMVEGRKLILGGVEIPHHKGLLGHSDADVLIHAIMDSILGALALGDIGKYFPDTDMQYKDISSMVLLEKVHNIMKEHGYEIGNIDSIVVAQEPKFAPYIDSMRENIAKAKLEILEGLRPDGLFVYCGDDPILKKEIEKLHIEQKILTYGKEDFNDYQCELGIVDENGVSFKLTYPNPENYYIPMLGSHNMFNATAAITVAKYFNIPFKSIQEGLYHIEKTGMRNELVYAEGFTILNDSYKSNPSSVLAALNTLYNMKQYKQKIVVLGDMLGLGEEEVKMHEEIGLKIDSTEIEYLFTIGPLAQHMGKMAKLNFEKGKVISCTNKPQLVEKLKRVIKPNSIILVKASRPLELEEVVERILEGEVIELESLDNLKLFALSDDLKF